LSDLAEVPFSLEPDGSKIVFPHGERR